jgi:hypothetical protein
MTPLFVGILVYALIFAFNELVIQPAKFKRAWKKPGKTFSKKK